MIKSITFTDEYGYISEKIRNNEMYNIISMMRNIQLKK